MSKGSLGAGGSLRVGEGHRLGVGGLVLALAGHDLGEAVPLSASGPAEKARQVCCPTALAAGPGGGAEPHLPCLGTPRR